jgi:serine palmitoyltransferase
MALSSPSPTPSIFKKKSNHSLPPGMASAASYLSAVSEADARARSHGHTPTSTPALSLSSSITSSSEDTVLDESEDNRDGLIHPRQPPTSEQVFTTVHTEFGHCANENYRFTSKHDSTAPVKGHVELDPPYYVLLTTYLSYLLLICIGHIRDFFGKSFRPSAYKHLVPHDVSPHILLEMGSFNDPLSVL